MSEGSKEWIEKLTANYKQHLEAWAAVYDLNQRGDYSQGYATTNNNGDYIIIMED